MGYVKDFIDHAIITYAGEQDKEVEERCLLYYQQARKEVKEWLKKVLIKELSASDYTSVYVKLYLPLGDMELRMRYHEYEGDCQPLCKPEQFYTPIGIMDHVTYEEIISEKDNPVAMLYDHLYAHVLNMRTLCLGKDEFLLGEDTVESAGVRDVLGLHRMEGVFYNVTNFLTNQYWK